MSELTGYCRTCNDEALISDAGLCVWCDTPIQREADIAEEKRRRGGRPKGKYRKMTEAQIRAAHVVYWQGMKSLRDVAALIWEQYGFANEKSCAAGLHKYFVELNLPRRDRIEETRRVSTTHGRAPKSRTSAEERAYRRWLAERRGWRSIQGPGQERCAGRLTGAGGRKGQPCMKPSLQGSIYCANHDPARAAERVASLAEARARISKSEKVPVDPFADFLARRVSEVGSQKTYARLLGVDNTSVSHWIKRERSNRHGQLVPVYEVGRDTVERWLERDGTATFDDLYGPHLASKEAA